MRVCILFFLAFELISANQNCCLNGHYDFDLEQCSESSLSSNIPECIYPMELVLAFNDPNFQEYQLVDNSLEIFEDSSTHQDFCIGTTNYEDLFVASFCKPPTDCDNATCVRKCCPNNTVFTNGTCQKDFVEQEIMQFHVLYGFPTQQCTSFMTLNGNYTISNGKLIINNQAFSHDEYCIMDLPNGSFEIHVCDHFKEIARNMILASQFVSIFFLILTFIFIWKQSKSKMYGIMILNLTLMLLLYFGVTLVSHFIYLPDFLCNAAGILSQYAYLSTVWWMNSICIDIWLTFRKIRQKIEATPKYGWIQKEFKYYAIWSYLSPLAITVITVFIDLFSNENSGYFNPGFGQEICSLSRDGLLMFQIVPTMLPIILNLLLVASTFWNLLFGIWSGDKDFQLRAKSIVKIFLATGISWTAEVSSWILYHFVEEDSKDFAMRIGLPLDLMNGLIGFNVFIAVVPWNKTTLKGFQKFFRKTSQSYELKSLNTTVK